MWWMVGAAFAGGAPRNALVIYNEDVPEAADVAAHYLDARPGAGKCPVSVDPALLDIPYADFVASIRDPLDACLADHPDVDYLVTVRGLPYRVLLPAYDASLEAVLQVGHAVDGTGADVAGLGQADQDGLYLASLVNPAFVGGVALAGDFVLSNPYQSSYQAAPGVVREDTLPKAFHRADTWTRGAFDYTGELFVVGRLDGFDYADADALIDRAIAAEASPPAGTLACMHGADDARGARDPECEFTTRMLQSAGFDAEWIDPFDGALAGGDFAALFTGADSLTAGIDGNTWEPGAIVDNLTSYGAVPQNFQCDAYGNCPAAESQTSIARWVRAGATGVHGTVDEPLNNSFPSASALLFYTFGYSAGESWLYAQHYLHWENLYLGDPLVSPWAVRPTIGPLPQGDALDTVCVAASHADGIASVTLWVDGEQVATDKSDGLCWTPDAFDGAVHALYAEAVAADVEVDRPGWPVENPKPRPGVTAWAFGSFVATAPVAADTDAATGGDGGGGEGCGCASGGGSSPWLGLAAALVPWRRARYPRRTQRSNGR